MSLPRTPARRSASVAASIATAAASAWRWPRTTNPPSVGLARVRIWKRNTAPEETAEDLVAGDDDAKFRLDRAELRECADLVTDRKELAELKRK